MWLPLLLFPSLRGLRWLHPRNKALLLLLLLFSTLLLLPTLWRLSWLHSWNQALLLLLLPARKRRHGDGILGVLLPPFYSSSLAAPVATVLATSRTILGTFLLLLLPWLLQCGGGWATTRDIPKLRGILWLLSTSSSAAAPALTPSRGGC